MNNVTVRNFRVEKKLINSEKEDQRLWCLEQIMLMRINMLGWALNVFITQ